MSALEYDRGKMLGKGTFGKVYLGTWGENRQPVAVKRLLTDDAKASENEERALKNLNHPNIIKLFDVQGDSDFR